MSMLKLKAEEIIKAVPSVQTVVLSDDWFDYLPDTVPVFISLYEWIQDNYHLSSSGRSLSSLTYVGEKMHKRLIAAEKKRISKRYKIKKDDLDSTIDFSVMDFGPNTTIGRVKLVGDAIIVIPENSRKALNDLAITVNKEDRRLEVKQARSNAAGPTFRQWLLSQANRLDRVGDVALDLTVDNEFPAESIYYEDYESYFNSINASQAATESLRQAWFEYMQQYPERIRKSAWCSECGNMVDVKDGVIAWVPDSGEGPYVLDAYCLKKYQDFEEVRFVPLLGITCADLEAVAEKHELYIHDVERFIEKLKLWSILPVDSSEGIIYFIQSEQTKAIKIGYTTGEVRNRVSSLQTAHPCKLHLLATMPGDLQYEKLLHMRFAEHRLEGEWFKVHPDLVEFIATLTTRNI